MFHISWDLYGIIMPDDEWIAWNLLYMCRSQQTCYVCHSFRKRLRSKKFFKKRDKDIFRRFVIHSLKRYKNEDKKRVFYCVAGIMAHVCSRNDCRVIVCVIAVIAC